MIHYAGPKPWDSVRQAFKKSAQPDDTSARGQEVVPEFSSYWVSEAVKCSPLMLNGQAMEVLGLQKIFTP